MTLASETPLESERLILRRIAEPDLEFYVRLHADPNVSRYIGHGRPRSSEESLVWLRHTLSTYESLTLGQLAVVRKSDGLLIGRCGLSDLAVEVGGTTPRAWYERSRAPDDIELLYERELGYTFDPSHWGRGYASEAARCVFEYARDVLRLSRIISVIHPDNGRSLRVARNFALLREDTLSIQGEPRDRYVWPIPAFASTRRRRIPLRPATRT